VDGMSGSGSVLFLGLDVGTTLVKAVVVDAAGALRASGAAPVPLHLVGPDGVQQDLGEIRAASAAAIADAARGCGADAARIAAVGVSSQGGALQLVAPDGSPKGPVVGWQDGRGRAFGPRAVHGRSARWLARRIGASSGHGCIGQLARLAAEGSLDPSTRIGWVGDRIVGWLCGRPAHDATSLSISYFCDPATGRENPDVMALLGLAKERFPDLLDARERAGGLLPEVARGLGLPAGIPVGPAVHDQYAAAVGCGATSAGDVMFGAGTAWVLLAMDDHIPRPLSGWSLIGRHPVPGLFGLMVSLGNGGSAFAWARDLLGLRGTGEADLDARMAAVAPGSEGLRFRPLLLPVGGGRRNRDVAGRLDGIRLGHGAPAVMRSVLEGLACELTRGLGMMKQAGVRAGRLVMCGRAAASRVTPGIVADVTGLPVDGVTQPETSAIGAAVLARAIVEPGTMLADLAQAMKPAVRRVAPGPGREVGRRLFEEYLASFRRG
jgi:xylulokinase